SGSIPLGEPIANTGIYLVGGFEPAPAGAPGELYIGGEGLARGYLGRPDLTAERFVPDAFSGRPGARLYRTGDLVRRRQALEFLGRADNQVKIRGFRIELGEIESVLGRLVRECAVVVRDERLVAYVALQDVDVEAVRGELRRKLPEYMVPSAFVVLPSLPLTPNGKVDRRALPDPAGERRQVSRPAERSAVEELVAGLWSAILGVPDVAPHESFFDLGGHSLLATRMVSRARAVLGVELPIRAVFEEPTLAGFAALAERALKGDEASVEPPLVRVPRTGALPASSAQQRLWFLDQLEPGSFAYNLAGAVRLEGTLDAARLAGALDGIVRRHESLRTRFVEVDGEPRQVIAEPSAFLLPVVDLFSLPAREREGEARRIAAAEARRPYDLGRGPLVRSTLLWLDGREHVLLAGMHHIVSDGWSLGIFLRELGALYRGEALPELAVQYADYAAWQRQRPSGDVMEGQLSWWKWQLSEAPQVIELPLDRPRPAVQSYRGGRMDLALHTDLESVARGLGVTPFMALLAGFATLLHRYGSHPDVVVGTPVANRGRAELEDLIGLFVNTLALRVDLSGDPGFDELARRVRETALGAFAHQEIPFERLVSELRPERDLSHAPVFQVLLAFQNLPDSRLDLEGLALSQVDYESGRTQYDLSLFVYPEARPLARLEYARDLFDATTAQRLLAHLSNLLAGIAEAPGRRLSELPLLVPDERAELLAFGSRTAAEVPSSLLHQLLTETTGEAIAGLEVYLLGRFEQALEPVPPGAPGELYLGGEGLARGYPGRPDLTAERFVPDALSGRPGSRLYRSGGLARRRARDGALELLGRADQRVKVRGFRIEPGEIEAVLSGRPSVRECAVVAREDEPAARSLVAYVALRDGDVEALRGELRRRLPEHMVPSAFVVLPSLPRTPDGEVDRRALPPPAEEQRRTDRAERSAVEELVAGIWCNVLGVPDVAPDDSFFDLGGHSLLATRMMARVRAVLGVDLPMRAVFQEPTLAGFAALARLVWRGDALGAPSLARIPRNGPLPASFAQQRLWFLDKLEPGSFAYNLAGAVRLEGVLDVAALAGAIGGIVRRHEPLRTVFVEVEGEPRQAIQEPAPFDLAVVDLAGLADRDAEAFRIAVAEARRPYDLARGPLVRSTLLRMDGQEHVLLIGMHHIVSDGWSIGIFVRELG
ncbi:MAG: condensation domain-containing protein, partial [Thermoanaerobaculia bacterium]